jgi:hypothetical protein
MMDGMWGMCCPGSPPAAVAITSATPVGFRCTIHPTMVGAINGEIPPAPRTSTV